VGVTLIQGGLPGGGLHWLPMLDIRRVALVKRKPLGGECTNWGCIPPKIHATKELGSG
jgi:pyruvate/2-oxoglutarate dehydrogenase complex dihydrolipoamide dehydrogenase (E3) component